jgi:hypothetical protein
MTSNRSIRSVTLVLGSLLLFCGLPMAAEVTAPPFVVVDGDAISTEEVDTSIAPPWQSCESKFTTCIARDSKLSLPTGSWLRRQQDAVSPLPHSWMLK